MRESQFLASIFSCLGASVLVLLVFASAVPAQTGRVSPPTVKDPKGDTLERQNREATLRSAEVGVAVEKTDQRRIDAAIEQIKEDFRHIQIVRNEIVRNILANKPLDYRLISEEAGDVRKRADRLKTSLAAPAGEETAKSQKNEVDFNDQDMKSVLVRLCKLIDSFVENPVLKTPGITDAQQSKKAASDLLNIIDLSGNIKRSADKLNKTPK
jgi:hypothetical protein